MACYVCPSKIQAISDRIARSVQDAEELDGIMESVCAILGYDQESYRECVRKHREASSTYRSKQKSEHGTTYTQRAKDYYHANKARLGAQRSVQRAAKRQADRAQQAAAEEA